MNTTTMTTQSNVGNASQETRSDKFPPQIKYIVWNEACERYSYYGMRSILVIFMVQYLMIAKNEATYVYHMFAGACYLFPVLGAFISDRFLGKYKTILYLSIVYCLGHLVLAIWENQMGLYWGLGLIALGSGGIKPCVSAHVGDQFNKSNSHLLKKVFDLFYWMINFGSFFSTLITPWMLPKFGPAWAFGIPGILMFIATIIFWMGRHQFVHVPPTGSNPHSALKVFASAWKNRGTADSFLGGALRDHPEEAVDGLKAALAVGKTFITITIFWALFDQHGSSWILQAKQMDLEFMGVTLLPSQIAALNPIMVMALIPLFATVIYPFAIHRLGINLTPLKKMGAGMFVAAFSFLFIAVLQYLLDSGVKLNVMWQFFPYLLITAAEVLISITGLEFAYTQAPRSMKSTIMSMWLLTVFFGNMITAYIAKVNVFEGGNFFMFFTALMLLVSFIFVLIAKNYQVRNYVEE
jgi:POT family proton-dependent oligopeptide transporter